MFVLTCRFEVNNMTGFERLHCGGDTESQNAGSGVRMNCYSQMHLSVHVSLTQISAALDRMAPSQIYFLLLRRVSVLP